MTNVVARRIAIRNAIAAREDGGTEVAKAPVAKAGKVKVAKVGGFPGDAGKVGMTVSKGELAAAMGVEGARGDLAVAQAILVLSPAVSQSVYDHADGVVTRTEARVTGFDGVVTLHDDFGRGTLRQLYLDEAVVADMIDVEGFADALATLQVVSDARQAVRDSRFQRLAAASKAKKEARLAAEQAPEAIAA